MGSYLTWEFFLRDNSSVKIYETLGPFFLLENKAIALFFSYFYRFFKGFVNFLSTNSVNGNLKENGSVE